MVRIDVDKVLDESLELLYGGTEEKVKGMNNILTLVNERTLEDVIENHQLISALARLLGESDDLPLDLTFGITKLFCTFSLIEDFHEILSSHRVGSLVMTIVELELKRAWKRGAESASQTKADDVRADNGTVDLNNFRRNYTFSKKSEQVIFFCLGVMDNLSDDFAILRKMMKKSLVSLLTRCLQQSSFDSLLITLSLLKKASVFEETAMELSSAGNNVIYQLGQLLSVPHVEMHHVVLETLFNLSFHHECIELIASAENIHSRLVVMLQDSSLCTKTLHLLYHLSLRGRQMIYEAGITPDLMELLSHTTVSRKMEKGFAGLLVNMTLHPLCSEELLHLGAHEHLLLVIQQSQRVETNLTLLRLARNLSQWSKLLQCRLSLALETRDMAPLAGVVKDPTSYIHVVKEDDGNVSQSSLYWEMHYWDNHIDLIIQNALSCEKEDLLVEWIGILNNFTRDDLLAGVCWHDLLDDHHGIVELFQKLLEPCGDDLKLELIIWLSNLSQECTDWIVSNDLINIIHTVFIEQQDAEIRLQILHTYEIILTRQEHLWLQVVSGDGVIDAMVNCLRSQEPMTAAAAERCLLLIDEFDRDEDGLPGEISIFIQHRRYEELVTRHVSV